MGGDQSGGGAQGQGGGGGGRGRADGRMEDEGAPWDFFYQGYEAL